MELRRSYEVIYEEMRGRNKSKLLLHGTKPDKALQSPIDNRIGLALFAFFKNGLGHDFDAMTAEATKTFPDQVIYTPNTSSVMNQGRLHFTFMQLFGVGQVPQIGGKIMDRYTSILEGVLCEIPYFSIQYSGLIALPSGLAMYGYPSIDINRYRDRLRAKLEDEDLEYVEPYKVDIAHSTFIRLKEDEDQQKLIDFAAKYDGMDLGTLSVDSLELAYGSWRMWPDECSTMGRFVLKG